jgi:DNA-binding transcriptional MerR regulator
MDQFQTGAHIYDRQSASRLLFIKRAKAFGFSLEEIRDLLAMRPENPRSCNRVMNMLDGKIEELGGHIREIQRFHRQLTGYRRQCGAALTDGEPCPLILEVSRADDGQKSSKRA